MNHRRRIALLLFLLTFALYLRTLAPSVAFLFDDSLEFQLVGFKLAIAHPTGYPLYTLLLKLFSLLPVGDVAYRANLSSALFGALAVTLVYLIVWQLSESIAASLVAAVALAISPVFWSQAVIAEVYALNAVFVGAISWGVTSDGWRVTRRNVPRTTHHAFLAFLFALALTHHRTIILLVPALIIYEWQVASHEIAIRHSPFAIRHSPLANRKSLFFLLLPLTLYLYLPLRGSVGSLDGSYPNTPEGFLRWITASDYNIFLSGNPFNKNYDAAFFFDLFLNQFGWLGLAFALVGSLALWRVTSDVLRKAGAGTWINSVEGSPFAIRHSPFALFLSTAFLAYFIFMLLYRVPDIEVFAIPALLMLSMAIGYGWHVVWRGLVRLRPRALQLALQALLMILLLVNFASIFQAAWLQNDLSGKTEVRDYGRDLLAQPLPADSTLIGILGEMTLVRYFQATEKLNPSLVTIAADRDDERMNAIERELRAGRAVFTTRPLNGLPEKYSLGALGPLVRVWPTPPVSDLPADAPRVDSIQYRKDGISQPYARLVRVHLTWRPTAPISTDLKISARLLDGDTLIAQKDDWPVHNTYHTTFWRAGEMIQDVYDLKIPPGTLAKTYRVLLIVYHADSGAEVGRVNLGEIELSP